MHGEAYASYPCTPSNRSNLFMLNDEIFPSDKWRSYPLAAPLPEDFYRILDKPINTSAPLNARPEVLRINQQEALRLGILYDKGNRKWQWNPVESPHLLLDWSIESSATVAMCTALIGAKELHTNQSDLVKGRDGFRCGACPATTKLEAAHVIAARDRNCFKEDVHWIRDNGLDDTFKKDLPGNAFTLCELHHRSMDDYLWTFVPSELDLHALIAYERSDYSRRSSLWAERRLLDDTVGRPPRTLPPSYMHSGWFEFLPLSTALEDLKFGPYNVIPRSSESEESQGGTLREGCITMTYEANTSWDPLATHYYYGRQKALVFWLGLADIFIPALLRFASNALGRGRTDISPRAAHMRDLVVKLIGLYETRLIATVLRIPRGVEYPAEKNIGHLEEKAFVSLSEAQARDEWGKARTLQGHLEINEQLRKESFLLRDNHDNEAQTPTQATFMPAALSVQTGTQAVSIMSNMSDLYHALDTPEPPAWPPNGFAFWAKLATEEGETTRTEINELVQQEIAIRRAESARPHDAPTARKRLTRDPEERRVARKVSRKSMRVSTDIVESQPRYKRRSALLANGGVVDTPSAAVAPRVVQQEPRPAPRLPQNNPAEHQPRPAPTPRNQMVSRLQVPVICPQVASSSRLHKAILPTTPTQLPAKAKPASVSANQSLPQSKRPAPNIFRKVGTVSVPSEAYWAGPPGRNEELALQIREVLMDQGPLTPSVKVTQSLFRRGLIHGDLPKEKVDAAIYFWLQKLALYDDKADAWRLRPAQYLKALALPNPKTVK